MVNNEQATELTYLTDSNIIKNAGIGSDTNTDIRIGAALSLSLPCFSYWPKAGYISCSVSTLIFLLASLLLIQEILYRCLIVILIFTSACLQIINCCIYGWKYVDSSIYYIILLQV